MIWKEITNYRKILLTPTMLVRMCKCVDQIDLAPMLAIMMSVGATSNVNLRNPLHTGEKACKRGGPLRL